MAPEPTGVHDRLICLSGIRAVLFDVYGTMFVSGSGDIGVAGATGNARALEEALSSAGFSCESAGTGERGIELLLQEIQEAHAKRRREGIEYPEVDIRQIWKDVLSALTKEELVRGAPSPEAWTRLAVEYECRVNPVWPMPGLADSLENAREKGVLLGIVSNAQFYTPLLFRAFLGGAPEEIGFRRSLCVWSYAEFEAKPSIGLFRPALRSLEREYGISASETLYVGNDRLNDLWPAGESGCRTALFAGDKRSLRLRENNPRCAAIEPDLVITDLR